MMNLFRVLRTKNEYSMNNIKHVLACVVLAAAGSTYQPLMAQVKLSSDAYPVIVAPHSQSVSYYERTLCYDITSNVDYDVTSDADWAHVRKADNGVVYVHVTYNEGGEERVAHITFKNASADLTETLTITQGRNESFNELPKDIKVPIASATANTSNSGLDIQLSYDDKESTFWHSQWTPSNFVVSENNPAILTYNFNNAEHIDYIQYVTRQDGNSNGNFGKVEVYAKCGSETSYSLITTVDLGYSGGNIKLGDEGLNNVKSIQIKVLSGSNKNASCAEMRFMKYNSEAVDYNAFFTDSSLSKLKDGVTKDQLSNIKYDFIRDLALGLYNKTYDEHYRVGEYTAKLSYVTQSNIWNAPGKYYDQRQGVTGINITRGQHAIAVSGLPEGGSVPMVVTAWYIGKDGGNFDGGNPQSFTYSLHNGLNVINYDFDYDGLAYVCYYADANPELQPKITVHFINGTINGYLSSDKTNDEMYEMTGKAKNVCMDVLGQKVHSVWTSDGLHKYCKATDGTSLGYRQYINVLDSLIQWEHELLGFVKYNSLPDNRTMAYTNYTYYMFQGGFGVSFHHNQESRVLNCKTLVYNDNDAIWGLSHEWGHQHQMHPYFCWAGMSEVTNNMNSYYNIMKMGYHESDKINAWPIARKHFIQDDISDIEVSGPVAQKDNGTWDVGKGDMTRGRRYSRTRRLAYLNANYMNNAALREICLSMADSAVTTYKLNPARALHISEVGVGETLCPFVMLFNYFTTHGKPDFAPDWYEALRQTDDVDGGSSIEKAKGFDKYELLAAAQNNNKNGLYKKLVELFPSSCWVKKGYVNERSTQWENSMPYVLNYIRKTSRLSGYNLLPYFEHWGFLRQVALYIGDYGNKWQCFNKEMYDEFKADMDALVADGTLKEMPEGMVKEISNSPDLFDSGYKDFGKTPTFPN